jgi:hypothetical protein
MITGFSINMRLSTSFLSFARRLQLIPSVFGISRQGVRIESGALCPTDLSSGGSSSSLVQVGEDACFVAPPTDTGHQVLGMHHPLLDHIDRVIWSCI